MRSAVIFAIGVTAASASFSLEGARNQYNELRATATEQAHRALQSTENIPPEALVCYTGVLKLEECSNALTSQSDNVPPKCIATLVDCIVGECLLDLGVVGELMHCSIQVAVNVQDVQSSNPFTGFVNPAAPTDAECKAFVASNPTNVCLANLDENDLTKASITASITKFQGIGENPKCATVNGIVAGSSATNSSDSSQASDMDSLGGFDNMTDTEFEETFSQAGAARVCRQNSPEDFKALENVLGMNTASQIGMSVFGALFIFMLV